MLNEGIFDLCTSCHENAPDVILEDAHTPLSEEASCTLCHLPHRSEHSDLLLRPVKELCATCHDSATDDTSEVPQPHDDSDCTECHNPHGSVFQFKLKMPPGFICIGCHDDILPDYAPSDMHAGTDLKSCDNCHSAHNTANPHMLRRDGSNLCLDCHNELGDVAGRKWPHEAVTDGACLDCHLPHFKKDTSSLVADETELCGECHDLDDEDFGKLHLNQIPRGCAECHDPHGGVVEKLIRQHQHDPFMERDCITCHEEKNDPSELRSSELCEMCHDAPEATGGHAPNLVGERTCVDCHSPHAGSTSSLLR